MTSSGANASRKNVKPANGSLTTARAGWRNAGRSASAWPRHGRRRAASSIRTWSGRPEAAFPWPLIARERRLFDKIVKPAPSVPATPREFPLQRRGLLWALRLVFGEHAFEALQKFHSSAAEIIGPDVWRLIVDLCPVTTDQRKLAKVTEFLGPAIAAIHPGWPHQKSFPRVAALAANVPRDWLAARIEAARARRDGLSLTELGDGWFRVKDKAVLPLLWEKCGRSPSERGN